MLVRKLTPLHGWRAFFGEVGIIVIGVGIALIADQAVEAWNWRQVVKDESAALDSEVRDVWDAMSSRVAQQPCVSRRLQDIARILDRHDRGEPLGIVGPIGRPRVWTAGRSALDIATADGAISHMPLDQKQRYFAVYGSFDTFTPSANEERASWRSLQALNRAASLTPADWSEVRKAYDAAADSNVSMSYNLKADEDGQWLRPFRAFPRWPVNAKALTLPSVKDLCAPAVR